MCDTVAHEKTREPLLFEIDCRATDLKQNAKTLGCPESCVKNSKDKMPWHIIISIHFTHSHTFALALCFSRFAFGFEVGWLLFSRLRTSGSAAKACQSGSPFGFTCMDWMKHWFHHSFHARACTLLLCCCCSFLTEHLSEKRGQIVIAEVGWMVSWTNINPVSCLLRLIQTAREDPYRPHFVRQTLSL